MTSEMAKRLKLNNNNIKLSRDEPVPSGYVIKVIGNNCLFLCIIF